MKEFQPLPPCGCTVCTCCTNYADEPHEAIYKVEDHWVMTDYYGDTYKLRPTRNPETGPLIITLEKRR